MVFIEHYLLKDGVKEKISLADMDAFISEQTPEGRTLEYKQPSGEKSDLEGLSEAIASFLNTNGGLLIYGVSVKHTHLLSKNKDVVEKQYPEKVMPCPSDITVERLQQILLPTVEPWNTDVRIVESRDESGKHVFLIDVPQSGEAPHMANRKFLFRTESGNEQMTYRQVSTAFISNRVEKKELAEHVYGPIYMDLDDILRKTPYGPQDHTRFDLMFNDFRYLWILVDSGLRKETQQFFKVVTHLNERQGTTQEEVISIVKSVTLEYGQTRLRDKSARAEIEAMGNREKDHLDVDVLILTGGPEPESVSPSTLWYYLFHQLDPIEAFQKKYPDKETSRLTLTIRSGQKMWPLHTQSIVFFKICKDYVERSQIVSSYRKNYSELREEATRLHQKYEQLLN